MSARTPQVLALLVFGAATAFVTSVMAAHLPGLLLASGLPFAVSLLGLTALFFIRTTRE